MKITNYLWIYEFKKTNLNSFETKKRLIFITLATTDSNETRRIHIRNEKVQIIFNTSQPITTPNNLSNPTFKNSPPSNIRISNIRTEKYILPRTRARLGKPRIKFQFPSRRFSHRRLDLSLVGAPTNTIVISRYFPSPSLARCVYIYIYMNVTGRSFVRAGRIFRASPTNCSSVDRSTLCSHVDDPDVGHRD